MKLFMLAGFLLVSLHSYSQKSTEISKALAEQIETSNFDQSRWSQIKFTTGLLQHFGAELTFWEINLNGRPGLYIEADWEVFKNYADRFSHTYGVNIGHSIKRNFFIALKIYREQGFKLPFTGIEVGGELTPFSQKRVSINGKIVLTTPLERSGVGLFDLPELQIGLGYRFSKKKGSK